MKSVKPGRAPSAMGAWMSVVAVGFGIFWTVMASSMGAPVIFPVFGGLFILTGIISGIYNFKNATGKNRYSSFDITDDGEEIDPLQAQFGSSCDAPQSFSRQSDGGYCPYCGTPAEQDFAFCRKCGKPLN